MERRGRRPRDWDGTVACRLCGSPVLLERERMTHHDGLWHITCGRCLNEFPVRTSDPDLHIVRDIKQRHS